MEDINQRNASEKIVELNGALDSLSASASNLTQDMKGLFEHFAETSKAGESLAKSFTGELANAFKTLVVSGGSLSDMFKKLASSMADKALDAAMAPIASAFAGFASQGIASILPFAQGGVIANGNVKAFAQGGIVNQPTNFPLQGGMGLMGEAGPEAIMPLTRGADGKLGVITEGSSRPINVTFNISTPDAKSFQKSQTQIAANLSRVISQANSKR